MRPASGRRTHPWFCWWLVDFGCMQWNGRVFHRFATMPAELCVAKSWHSFTYGRKQSYVEFWER
jgi:hypothetical protein